MQGKTQQEQIVDVFQAAGGLLSMRHLAKLVRKADIFSAEQLEDMALKGIQAYCRRAMAGRGPDGLPVAVVLPEQSNAAPDTDDSDAPEQLPLWQLTALLDKQQLFGVIRERCVGLDRDYAMIQRFRDHCLERFGEAPEIPELLIPAGVQG